MPTRDPKFWITIIAGVIAALATGVGGPRLAPDWFRPSPYTAVNAAQRDLVVDYRLAQHEADITAMQDELSRLPPEKLLERVDRLERELHEFMIRHESSHR